LQVAGCRLELGASSIAAHCSLLIALDSLELISNLLYIALSREQMNVRSVRQAQRLYHNLRTINGSKTSIRKLHDESSIPANKGAVSVSRCYFQHFSTITKPRKNYGLESVKEEGLGILDAITKDVKMKTKQKLYLNDENVGPTITQIQEADRIQDLMEEVLEQYVSKRGNMFCVGGDPIVIVDVEVSDDLKQARVFWSLPFNVLLNEKVKRDMRGKLVQRMQYILDERGGVLQGMLHRYLRSYHRPPRIRFVQAEGEILRKFIMDEL
jgi:ribosome-binding factor A